MRHRSLAAKRVWIKLRHVFTLKAGCPSVDFFSTVAGHACFVKVVFAEAAQSRKVGP